jgi:hypothetical protein
LCNFEIDFREKLERQVHVSVAVIVQMVVVWVVTFVFLYLETGVSEEYAANMFMIVVARTRM